MSEDNRDHLFISYAKEDYQLADWLALKLTSEGYNVWYDRFKLLGGESYPKNINHAIKNRTFRFLALMSKSSMCKENPLGERTLALNIGKEKKEDFVIPINVDGLSPTELDWMTSHITFIPFNKDWALGLSQLLEKLESINAPKTVNDGKSMVSKMILANELVKNGSEKLYANNLKVQNIPDKILYFRFGSRIEVEKLSQEWAFYKKDEMAAYAFNSPPNSWSGKVHVLEERSIEWKTKDRINGIPTNNIIVNLIKQSVEIKCRSKGLARSSEIDGHKLYFPSGLLKNDTIKFRNYLGKSTRVNAAGKRSKKIFIEGLQEKHQYWYYLSPSFRCIPTQDGYVLQINIQLHITKLDGTSFSPRSKLTRRKSICKDWWNQEWLNRHIAVASFLSDGKEDIMIGDEPDKIVIISSKLTCLDSPVKLDESQLRLDLVKAQSRDEDDEIIENEGD